MFFSLSKKGSALIISLVVMTLLTMISTVFFEKVYRFSQRSEGIENSNVAYYKALGIIESSLFTGGVDKYTPWNIQNGTIGGTFVDSGALIRVATGGLTIPVEGKGNSPYDVSKNYNIISIGEPVQIVIPDGINWANIDFEFRVPIIGGNSATGVATTASNTGFILWTIASSGASLFASGETSIFKGSDINTSSTKINLRDGITNSGSDKQFSAFYTELEYLGSNGAKCANYKCTLKLSLIRTVPTTDVRDMSFLEYRISGFTNSIPSQYMDIHAEGYAYGFLRSRNIQFPQITTNTALDFAVLQ